MRTLTTPSIGIAVLLFSLSACDTRPGSSRWGRAQQALNPGQVAPIPCPPNIFNNDAYDTCDWLGEGSGAIAASSEFNVVGANQSESQGTIQVFEAAQTFQVNTEDALPGSIGLTIKLLSNTSSQSTDNDLVVDLVGPLTGTQIPGLLNSEPPPLATTAMGSNCDTDVFAPLLATGRYNSAYLEYGVDTQVQINFTYAPTTPNIHMLTGQEYAFVFYMEQPGINHVGIAANAPDTSKFYCTLCPSNGIDPTTSESCICDSITSNTVTQMSGAACAGLPIRPNNDGSDCTYPIGFSWVRQEREASAGCVTNGIWVPQATADLNFYTTVNDGCGSGANRECGQGICERSVPLCDSYGNPIVCHPGACTTNTDCVLNYGAPNPIPSGASCINPTGAELAGTCTTVAETCDGYDDNCNGLTDEGLGYTSCGAGACSTSVYNCVMQTGNTAGCTYNEPLPNRFTCVQSSTNFGTPTVCTNYEAAPSAEVCNGIDDNCNGVTDEGLTDTATCGFAACARVAYSCVLPTGDTAACNSGDPDGGTTPYYCDYSSNTFGETDACSPNLALATTEICNDVDDDCDGYTDNAVTGVAPSAPGNTGKVFQYWYPDNTAGKPSGPPAAYDPTNPATYLGDCHYGIEYCVSTMVGVPAWDPTTTPAVAPVTPIAEVSFNSLNDTWTWLCDNQDNDCDGYTDNWPQNQPSAMTRQVYPESASYFDTNTMMTVACSGPGTCCDWSVNAQGFLGGAASCIGQCQLGTDSCDYNDALGNPDPTSTHWHIVTAAVLPSTEVCNGLDDNCNGETDEGLGSQVCGNGVCAQVVPGCQFVDAGNIGYTTLVNCSAGSFTNLGNTAAASTEVCNGLDDDCDGWTDNFPPGSGPSYNMVEQCHPLCAQYNQLKNATICQYPNGNSNGLCRPGLDACDGVSGWSPNCGSGGLSEIGPSDEQCNGLDDDCDGYVDNVPNTQTPITQGCDFLCAAWTGPGKNTCIALTGQCKDGAQTCVSAAWGSSCSGETGPSGETCNGLDDDCDGFTDNAVGSATNNTLQETCSSGCSTTPGCEPGVGQCSNGTSTCHIGHWGSCADEVGPTSEVCNDLDDNCDGYTDNAIGVLSNDSLTQHGDPLCAAWSGCIANKGQCVSALQDCGTVTPGTWTSVTTEIGPSSEICNDEDDDCDGFTDNRVTGSSAPLQEACSSLCSAWNASSTTAALRQYQNCVGDLAYVLVDGVGVCPDYAVIGQYDTATCTPQTGRCSSGSQNCTLGDWGSCSGEIGPTPEVCNGLDDDCNGQTDEGLGYTTCGLGTCRSTLYACYHGQPVDAPLCAQLAPQPTTEVCNNLDDNCNGYTDEGLGFAACGVGQCRTAVYNCIVQTGNTAGCDYGVGTPSYACIQSGTSAGTATVCANYEGSPTGEVCNDLDDDCDGYTDNATGVHTNNTLIEACDSLCTAWNAAGGQGHSQGDTCIASKGQCVDGAQTCTSGSWGASCAGEIGPSTEVCNAEDDDCDGYTDNNPAHGSNTLTQTQDPLCQSWTGAGKNTCQGLGQCVSAVQTCTTGTWGATSSETGPSNDVCNGKDDDCDGYTDNTVGSHSNNTITETCDVACQAWNASPTSHASDPYASCQAGVGICSNGTQTCTFGSWGSTCPGEIGPTYELCNDLDDDCDGYTDNAPDVHTSNTLTVTCSGASCTAWNASITGHPLDPYENCVNGVGACSGSGGGTGACAFGVVSGCSGGSSNGPTYETCNNIDDDCDGYTDNNPGDYTSYSLSATLDPLCQAWTGSGKNTCQQGVGQCVSGAEVCKADGTPRTLGSSQNEPNYTAVDSSGNVYWTDYGSGRIVKYASATGTVSTLASGQTDAWSIAVDRSANVYWTTFAASGNVVKYSGGTLTTLASAQDDPNGVAIDSSGNVYWGNYGTTTIMKYTLSSATTSTVSSTANEPVGVVIDTSGNLYWANYGNNAVVKDSGGTLTTLATSQSEPGGIAIDSSNNIYWTAGGNSRVMEYTAGGTLVTIATGQTDADDIGANGNTVAWATYNASGTVVQSSGGTITTLATAQDDPGGISIDSQGNVYWATYISGGSVLATTAAHAGNFLTSAETGPSTEICNDRDDDCDGFTDNAVGSASNNTLITTCDPSCQSWNASGGPDFGLTTQCGLGVGECVAGGETCTFGALGLCANETGPSTEQCNNLDDDCDGYTDNALNTLSNNTLALAGSTCDSLCQAWNANPTSHATDTNSCTEGVGQCKAGVNTCSAGTWGSSCGGEIGPTAEICNKLDDDCDGYTDNASGSTVMGSVGGPFDPECSAWSGCIANTGQCTSGAETCLETIAGGTPTTLYSGGEPNGLDIDSNYAYFTNYASGGGLIRVPIGGGTATTMASGYSNSNGILVGTPYSSPYVYWDTYSSSGPLLAVPIAGGAVVTLATGEADAWGVAGNTNGTLVVFNSQETGGAYPTGIAMDNTYIYEASYYFSDIVRQTISGSTLVTLESGRSGPIDIKVSGSNLYWIETSGNLLKTTTSGGAITTIATGYSGAEALAIDSTYAYFVTNNNPGMVLQVALTGGTVYTVATGQIYPVDIRADSSHLYWTNYGTGSNGSVVQIPLAHSSVSANEVGPSTETCNNKDDNCDGVTDNASGSNVPYSLTQTVDPICAATAYCVANTGQCHNGTQGCSSTVPGLITLASGQTAPDGITADSEWVYWTDYATTATGAIMKTPIGGGAISTVLGSLTGANSVFQTGGVLDYTTDLASGGYLGEITTGGTAITQVSDTDAWGVVSNGTSLTALLSAVSPGSFYAPLGITIDSNNTYRIGSWSSSAAILQTSISGGTTTTLATGQNYPLGMAVDPNYVYWTNSGDTTSATGTVVREPIGGGTITTLATGLSFPADIVVDTVNAYVTQHVTGTGSVVKTPLINPSGVVSTLASNQSGAWDLWRDSSNLYWTDSAGGTVMQLPMTDWTTTTAEIGPSGEICNNLDDNCDGYTDNLSGVLTNNTLAIACDPTCSAWNTTGEGADAGDLCVQATGQCRNGGEACTFGTTSACTGETGPSIEVCNNLDDDCDGYTDNLPKQGNYSLTESVDPLCQAWTGTGKNTCMANTGQCKNGTGTCEWITPTAVQLSSDGNGYIGIAVDSTYVYWTDYTSSGGLYRVPIAGGSVLTLSSGDDYGAGVYVDSTNVYWADYDAPVREQPKGGGTIVTLGNYDAWGVVADSSKVYYALGQGDQIAYSTIGTAGGSLYATTSDYPYGITDDSTNVYWVTTAGSVVKLAKASAGGTPTTLASGQSSPAGVAVDSTYVYWVNYGSGGSYSTGSVCRIPIAGGSVTTLVSGGGNPLNLAIDSTYVYWANNWNPSSGDTAYVAKVPKAGGTITTMWSTTAGNSAVSAITVDSNNVYFAGQAGVYKLPLQGTSTYGITSSETGPSTEQCNNKDDDCDGFTDNAVGSQSNNTLQVACDSQCQSWNTSGTGHTAGDVCLQGVGQCVSGTGTCSFGSVGSSCSGETGPTIELCNGLDDDCDGYTDNNPTQGTDSLTQSVDPLCQAWSGCVANTGQCKSGTQECAGALYNGGTSVTLATGQSEDWNITAFGGKVYWTYGAGGDLLSQPIGGGVTTTLSTLAGLPYYNTLVHDSSGNLYWINSSASTLLKLSGTTTSTIATSSNGISTSYGLTIDKNNNLYWTNSSPSPGNVIEMTAGGTFITLVTGTGTSYADGPRNIGVDDWGDLFWTNYSSNVVMERTSGGDVITLATATQTANGSPWWLTVDSSGNVYWANSGSVSSAVPAIQEWTRSTGAVTTLAPGVTGNSDPYGITVDGSGNVYWMFESVGGIWEYVKSSGTIVQKVSGASGSYPIFTDSNYLWYATTSTLVELPLVASTGWTTQAVEIGPSTEICNNLDDNCDGYTDNITGQGNYSITQNDPLCDAWQGSGKNTCIPNTGQCVSASGSCHAAGGLTTIATGQSSPTYITASSSGNVYWTNYNSSAAVVGYVGGTVTTLDTAQAYPRGITTDSSGNVYWANSDSGTANVAADSVVKYSGSTPSTLVTSVGSPYGVAWVGSTLYWTNDVSSGTIYDEVEPAGGAIATITGFTSPTSIVAYSTNGDIFLNNNTNSGTILKRTSGGTLSTITTGQGTVNEIAVDSSENVYWASASNSTVVKSNSTGSTITTLATSQTSVWGVAVDSAGDLFWTIAVNTTGSVTELPSGSSTTVALATGQAMPEGITTDGSGNVYWVNEVGNTVQKFSLTGWVAANGASGVETGPSTETCNNKDDDCDGFTDNAVGSAANNTLTTACDPLCQTWNSTGSGATNGDTCIPGTGQCVTGGTTCTWGDAGATCLNETGPSAEQCNGLDDDCDGYIDNNPRQGNDSLTTSSDPLCQAWSGCVANAGQCKSATSVCGGRYYNGGTAITLATGQSSVYSITTFGGNVYWGSSAGTALIDAPIGGGAFTTLVASPGDLEYNSITHDSSGNVCWNNTSGYLLKSTPSGTVSTLTSTAVSTPYGIAMDKSGNIYWTNSGTSTIAEYTAGGSTLTLVSGTTYVDGPHSIVVDDWGDLFWTNASNNTVEERTAAGDLVTIATATQTVSGQPTFIALDGSGNVYWTNFSSLSSSIPAVQEWVRSTGTVTNLVAGSTSYEEPFDIAVDGAGNVYFGSDDGEGLWEYVKSSGTTVQKVSGIYVYGLATDSNYLYYFNESASAVMELALDSTDSYTTQNVEIGPSTEICNGLDDNCDGYTDNVAGGTTNYSITQNDPLCDAWQGTGKNTCIAGHGQCVSAVGTCHAPVAITTIASSQSSPTYIAVSPSGTVYWTNSVASSASTGVMSYNGSTVSTLDASQSYPKGITTDSSGNVYWANYNNGTAGAAADSVVKYSGGTFTTLATALNSPWGVAWTNNTLYWTIDNATGTVTDEPEPAGGTITTITGFTSPTAIAAYSNGDIFFNNNTGSIVKRTSGGVLSTLVSSQSTVYQIGVDTSENVYWASYGNSTIVKSNSTGSTITTLATSQTDCWGIVVDGAGNVYWTDAAPTTGTVNELPSGSSTVEVLASGLGTPEGITIDSNANLYWVNETGDTVQKLGVGWAQTSNETGPSTEVCNNKDDDCDGFTDNAVGSASNNTLVSACDPLCQSWNSSGGTGFTAGDTCQQGTGQCRSGSATCTSGTPGSCAGETGPSGEQCNGLDDDCDGYTDNNPGQRNDSLTTSSDPQCQAWTNCVANTGQCRSATTACGGLYYNGGSAITLATGQSSVYSITTFGGNVYWGSSAGTALIDAPIGGGAFTTLVASPGDLNFNSITHDSSGNVYWNNTSNLLKITPSGTVSTLTSTNVSTPYGIAMDKFGNIYWTNSGTSTIAEYTAGGSTLTLVSSATLVDGPRDIVVDDWGDIFWTNVSNNTVMERTVAGDVITIATATQTDNGEPLFIALDGSGNVYWTNFESTSASIPAVQEWVRSTGTITNLVPGSTSHEEPYDIAVDGAGNVYFGSDDAEGIWEYVQSSGTTVQKVTGISVYGLTTDSNYLYYFNASGSTVMQLALDTTDSYTTQTIEIGPSSEVCNNLDDDCDGWTDNTPGVHTNYSITAQAPLCDAWTGTGKNTCIVGTGQCRSATGTCSASVGVQNIVTGQTDPEHLAIQSGILYWTNAGSSGSVVSATTSGASLTTIASSQGTPWGVTADTSGNVYWTNESGNTIMRRVSGTVSTVTSSSISEPYAIAWANNTLFWSNPGEDTVETIPEPAGGTITTISTGETTGVAIYSNGDLYWDDDGTIIKRVGTTNSTIATSQGLYIYNMVLDSSENLYWASYTNSTIGKYTTSTATMSTLASGQTDAFGIAVDSSGNVFWTTQASSGSLLELPSGSSTAVILANGLNDPSGVVVDNAGYVYWENYGAGTISKLQYTAWSQSGAETGPSTEICNNEDDDCDGYTDNNVGSTVNYSLAGCSAPGGGGGGQQDIPLATREWWGFGHHETKPAVNVAPPEYDGTELECIGSNSETTSQDEWASMMPADDHKQIPVEAIDPWQLSCGAFGHWIAIGESVAASGSEMSWTPAEMTPRDEIGLGCSGADCGAATPRLDLLPAALRPQWGMNDRGERGHETE